uniref:DUF4461 domain-containing protein n=1 Tax=Macrostomum lignano TaxID=282301 RepID=A0A1I8FHE5_9PLAT
VDADRFLFGPAESLRENVSHQAPPAWAASRSSLDKWRTCQADGLQQECSRLSSSTTTRAGQSDWLSSNGNERASVRPHPRSALGNWRELAAQRKMIFMEQRKADVHRLRSNPRFSRLLQDAVSTRWTSPRSSCLTQIGDQQFGLLLSDLASLLTTQQRSGDAILVDPGLGGHHLLTAPTQSDKPATSGQWRRRGQPSGLWSLCPCQHADFADKGGAAASAARSCCGVDSG